MGKIKLLPLVSIAAAACTMSIGASAASATTLEAEGVAQNKTVSVTITNTTSSTVLFKDTTGASVDTCTSSELFGASQTPFTASSVAIKLALMSFTGCTHTLHVLKPGKLSVTWTSGTNGTLVSSEAEMTIFSTALGVSVVCKTGAGTAIGTITGTKTSQAVFDLAAVTECGMLGSVAWGGSYRVTTPEGLGVVN
jgi:hypothetical protein